MGLVEAGAVKGGLAQGVGVEEEDLAGGVGRVPGRWRDEGGPAVGDTGRVAREGIPQKVGELLVGPWHGSRWWFGGGWAWGWGVSGEVDWSPCSCVCFVKCCCGGAKWSFVDTATRGSSRSSWAGVLLALGV